MKLRFRAHVNISRATFRPEALNSTSIGGFFVHRDFENVEQFQQVQPVEEVRRREAPPRPTQKRPKSRELDKGGEAKKEDVGEGGSGLGTGKVESKKTGKEGEKKKKKAEEKKKEIGKGGKGDEGAIGGIEIKGEVKKGKNEVLKIGKGEEKKKVKKDDIGKATKKEKDGKKDKVSGDRDKEVKMSVGRRGAPGEEFSEAGNPLFATMGDKKGKEGSKSVVAKTPAKSTKKDKGGSSEAGNPLFATMGDKVGKENSKGEEANPPAKSSKKDKGGFSEAGNPLFATMGDKVGKENSKGAVVKIPAKSAKKEEGMRKFLKKKKDVEASPKVEVVAPKPRKLPPVDMNAPSAKNPLLQYKERTNSGQLQVNANPNASNDADSGDEFDA